MDTYQDMRMNELSSRIEETKRVRRALFAHLGERVYNQVVADPDLRNGKEEVLGAIAACNREIARMDDAVASLDARLFAQSQVREVPASAEPVAPQAADTVVAAPVDVLAEPVVCEPIGAVEPLSAPAPVTLDVITPEVATAEPALAEADQGPQEDDVALEAAPTIALDRTTINEASDTASVDAPKAFSDEAPQTRTCPACGCEVGQDHVFCMNCGQRLG